MHVVNASSAFDVSFRHLSRLAPVPSALFSSKSREGLRTVGQALSPAVQGLAFALAIWLLLALPVFLFAQ